MSRREQKASTGGGSSRGSRASLSPLRHPGRISTLNSQPGTKEKQVRCKCSHQEIEDIPTFILRSDFSIGEHWLQSLESAYQEQHQAGVVKIDSVVSSLGLCEKEIGLRRANQTLKAEILKLQSRLTSAQQDYYFKIAAVKVNQAKSVQYQGIDQTKNQQQASELKQQPSCPEEKPHSDKQLPEVLTNIAPSSSTGTTEPQPAVMLNHSAQAQKLVRTTIWQKMCQEETELQLQIEDMKGRKQWLGRRCRLLGERVREMDQLIRQSRKQRMQDRIAQQLSNYQRYERAIRGKILAMQRIIQSQ